MKKALQAVSVALCLSSGTVAVQAQTNEVGEALSEGVTQWRAAADILARRRQEKERAEAQREARQAEEGCAPRGREAAGREASILGMVFPNLGKTTYYIMAEATREYNCIAWSVLIEDNWEWPGDTVAEFDVFFSDNGYELVEDFEDATVALYVDGNGAPTHAARRDGRGGWSSKCGGLAKVTHETLEDLESVETEFGVRGYGTAVRFYAPTAKAAELRCGGRR